MVTLSLLFAWFGINLFHVSVLVSTCFITCVQISTPLLSRQTNFQHQILSLSHRPTTPHTPPCLHPAQSKPNPNPSKSCLSPKPHPTPNPNPHLYSSPPPLTLSTTLNPLPSPSPSCNFKLILNFPIQKQTSVVTRFRIL
jgi:hypothetical protein